MSSPQEAILFLGITAGGKSSIIAAATGANARGDYSSKPCTLTSEDWKSRGTRTCKAWTFNSKNGRSVALIDTPGLDQMGMSNHEVLRSVIQYLEAHPNLRIIAMVYVLPIVQGTYIDPIGQENFVMPSQRMLKTFQRLCGEHYYQNVVVVTTTWPDLLPRDYKVCEILLRVAKGSLKDMIAKGVSYIEYADFITDNSKEIIDACLSKIDPATPRFVSKLRSGIASNTIITRALLDAQGFAHDDDDSEGEGAIKSDM